jgi:hypothetical protein
MRELTRKRGAAGKRIQKVRAILVTAACGGICSEPISSLTKIETGGFLQTLKSSFLHASV